LQLPFLLSLQPLFGFALFLLCAAPEKGIEFRTAYYQIPENELDPSVWAKAYPLHYERFMLNSKPSPMNKSKYQKGWDENLIIYDKLSEFPYLALLYHGWGIIANPSTISVSKR